jgi:integrase
VVSFPQILTVSCARNEFRGFEQERGLTLHEALVDFVADYQQRGLRDVQITKYRAGNLRAFFKEIPAADITERKEEFETIVGFLPDYLKDLTRFAYHTGWRKGEILTLEWRDIHGDVIRLRPEIAKNKDGRMIILVGEVANIIDRRRAERVESCPYVFHRQGNRSEIIAGLGGKHESSLGCRNACSMIYAGRRRGRWIELRSPVLWRNRLSGIRQTRCTTATGLLMSRISVRA